MADDLLHSQSVLVPPQSILWCCFIVSEIRYLTAQLLLCLCLQGTKVLVLNQPHINYTTTETLLSTKPMWKMPFCLLPLSSHSLLSYPLLFVSQRLLGGRSSLASSLMGTKLLVVSELEAGLPLGWSVASLFTFTCSRLPTHLYFWTFSIWLICAQCHAHHRHGTNKVPRYKKLSAHSPLLITANCYRPTWILFPGNEADFPRLKWMF